MSTAEDRALERAWPLWKEQVVFLILAGNTQQEVADILEKQGITISRQGISAIMQTEEAKGLVAAVKIKFRENLMTSIEEELDAASQLALRAVKKTLSADLTAIHKAKPNQDRVALKVLQGRGYLAVESPMREQSLQVPPEILGKLVTALEKSAQAKDIDPFENKGPVVEAEVEIVNDDDNTEDQ